jgi:hypothetical protein
MRTYQKLIPKLAHGLDMNFYPPSWNYPTLYGKTKRIFKIF